MGAAVDDVVINATTDLDLGTGFGNTIAASATNTITISGTATTVDLGSNTVDADVDTIDASGLTAGGVVYTQTSTTGDFTGGAGNDTVNLRTTALGATSTINAGAGTDTVTFTNSTNFSLLLLLELQILNNWRLKVMVQVMTFQRLQDQQFQKSQLLMVKVVMPLP